MNKNELGHSGESRAADFLKQQGYRILEHNYRLKIGEVDIVAKEGHTICFVEVKTRATVSHGSPFEAVSKAKQKRMTKVALSYLSRHRLMNQPARFDVVAINVTEEGIFKIELLRNAFDAIET